jgi:hypothetical protein
VVLAASVLDIAFLGAALIAFVLIGGRVWGRHGEVQETHGGRGESIPQPPGFRKPPGGDGGLL